MIRRAVQVGVGLALATGSLVLAALPSGAAPAGGPVQVWGTPSPNGGGGSVIFTGAVADRGKAVSATATGKPQKKGTYKLLVMTKGSILVNTTQLNNDANNSNIQPNPFNTTTCSGVFSVTAPVPVVSGTKLYAGINGSVNLTLTFAFVIPLQSGKCNTSNNGPAPSIQYGSITGTGTVNF
jgi:hypothetical protein